MGLFRTDELLDSMSGKFGSRLLITVMLYRPDGSKKAFARLTPDVDALDIAATKLSIV